MRNSNVEKDKNSVDVGKEHWGSELTSVSNVLAAQSVEREQLPFPEMGFDFEDIGLILCEE